MERDDRLQHVDRIVGLLQDFELFRDPEPRLHFAQDREVCPLFPRRGQERLPGRQAGSDVMLVDILNLGHLRDEEWVGGIPFVKRLQQLEGTRRLPLVPEVDHVQLIVGLALQQAPAIACAQHLIEAFLAVAPRKEHQEAQELGRRRRDVGIVLVQADTEIRILERRVELDRTLERDLDRFAVARSRQFFIAQDAPLDACCVGATVVEPRLGILGRAVGPGLGARDRAINRGGKLVVQLAALGVEQNLPPQGRGAKDVARFGRRGTTGTPKLSVDLVEACLQNEIVGTGEAIDAANLMGRRRNGLRGGRCQHGEHDDRAPP